MAALQSLAAMRQPQQRMGVCRGGCAICCCGFCARLPCHGLSPGNERHLSHRCAAAESVCLTLRSVMCPTDTAGAAEGACECTGRAGMRCYHQRWVIGPDHIEEFRICRSDFWVAAQEMLQSDPTLLCTADTQRLVWAAAGHALQAYPVVMAHATYWQGMQAAHWTAAGHALQAYPVFITRTQCWQGMQRADCDNRSLDAVS